MSPGVSLESIAQEQSRRSLLRFILHTFPDYQAGWFHRQVCAKMDAFLGAVERGESPRLMLLAPPRHGKTEIVSRRFPAYVLGRHPDWPIIAASYAASLAKRNARDVQRIIESPAYRGIFPGTRLARGADDATRGAEFFEIPGRSGSYRSAGIEGGISGMGARVLLIDDPIKDAEQAGSKTWRDKQWEWYQQVAYPRLESAGGILLIVTRWHEDDMAGRMIIEAAKGGEAWEVCEYPAIAERDELDPATNAVLRREGEALHPARYGVDQLQKIKLAIGARAWVSLYQQKPTAAEGTIFLRENWARYKKPFEDPRLLVPALGISRVVSFWDTAFEEGQENDYTACTTIGVAQAAYYVLDHWKHKVEFPELKRAVKDHHAKWNEHAVCIEKKASGHSLVQELKRESRVPVQAIEVDRDKVARANSITPVHEAKLIHLPEGEPWVADFIESHAQFPNAAHDDDVDSLVGVVTFVVHGAGNMGAWEYYRQAAEEALRAKKPEPPAGITQTVTESPWHAQ